MSRHPQNTLHLRLYLAYCVCALVLYVLLMAFVLPWWHSANHPVVANLGAGSAQKIGISYSPDEDPLILVPVGDSEGYYWKWATELPPRPDYELQMVFPEGTVGDVVFKQLELIQLNPIRRSSFLKIRDVPLMERHGIQLTKLVDGIRIVAEPGAVLDLELEAADPTAFTWVKTWARSSFGYLICALMLLFSLASILQFPDRVQAYRKRTPAWELFMVLAFAAIGSAGHLHLLNYSMPVFTPGASDQYVELAIRMHDGLELAEDGSLSLPDSPGYALFLSQVAGRFDWDLHPVILVQGLLFCFALALVGLATSRLINAWIIGPVLVLACMSPAALWVNRHIGVESLTVTLWLTSLAAFLHVWQTEKTAKWLAYALFGIPVAIAIAVSSAGLILLVLPLGMLAGTLTWAIATRRTLFWKLEVLWRTSAQVVLSLLIVVTGCYLLLKAIPGEWDLYSLPDSDDPVPAVAQVFESRAIEDREELSMIINQRIENDYSTGWYAFADSLTVERSCEMLPLQMKLAIMGKLTFWGFFLPDVETAPEEDLRRDYTIRNRYANGRTANLVQDSIAGIMSRTGRAVFLPERHSNKYVALYNEIIPGFYRWFYTVLFYLGLAGWLVGLVDRKYLAGLFILPFMLNILWWVSGMRLSSEAIQSMDALLLLGALAGLLGANAKSLQKPKDETDRRTLRPIRPKRLLIRQDKTPYVHHGN